jgi:hypothetical protein
MCSGTESPLLALELIQKSIMEQHGLVLEIEHVFSCEIEPFKQAYIERNFHPPLLFRDVCELGDEEAYVICNQPTCSIQPESFYQAYRLWGIGASAWRCRHSHCRNILRRLFQPEYTEAGH